MQKLWQILGGELISIHALCEEGDRGKRGLHQRHYSISIHALCEEGDRTTKTAFATSRKFLSTPSARRATDYASKVKHAQRISIHALCEEGDPAVAPANVLAETYFYPRPLRGGRPAVPQAGQPGADISIHALCEEGDLGGFLFLILGELFLSTPSARRATGCSFSSSMPEMDFYPRPLRGGRHSSLWITQPFICYFYPRPLRGGRHELRLISGCRFLFLSTPSARRATPNTSTYDSSCNDFYPRPLRGGRLVVHRRLVYLLWISIHALCEEGDSTSRRRKPERRHFYPRPLRGGRRQSAGCPHRTDDFYPRPLRGGRRVCDGQWQKAADFYPRPLRGGRRTL